MTQASMPGSSPGRPDPIAGNQDSTTQVLKEQAGQVGHSAAQAGGQVAQTAKEQGKEVAAEAVRQGRDLYHQAREQLSHQTGRQQQRAAGGLRSIADEIGSMADKSGQSGPATMLARQASGAAHQVADWLEDHEPGELMAQVRAYARRNPGTFLAGAALLGVLAGRLTRNASGASGSSTGSGGSRTGYPQNTGYPETTGYPESQAPEGTGTVSSAVSGLPAGGGSGPEYPIGAPAPASGLTPDPAGGLDPSPSPWPGDRGSGMQR